jgi:hypothetical protein
MDCFASLAMTMLRELVRQNNATGKSKKPVQPSQKKYSAFAVGQISGFSPRVSPTEGRLAIVTNARWDAVDAEAATDERGGCGRRSRVVLAPRCWRQACGAIRK